MNLKNSHYEKDFSAGDLNLAMCKTIGIHEFGKSFEDVVEDVLHACNSRAQVSPSTREFLFKNSETSIAAEYLSSILEKKEEE